MNEPELPNVLEAQGLTLHCLKRELRVCGETHRLTPTECRLLAVLMQHAGETLKHDLIVQEVWGTDFVDDIRTVYVHISWLRKKIEQDPGDPDLIQTVRGVGYRFANSSPE